MGIGAYYFFFIRNGEIAAPTEPEVPVTFTIGNEDITLNQATSTQNKTGPVSLNEETVVTGSGVVPKLRKISQSAIAGMISRNVMEGANKKTAVRFIERATGHVYEIITDSWTLERISNTTIPKIFDALWGVDSNSLYVRRILDDTDEIETYFATLKPVPILNASTTGAQESTDSPNSGIVGNFTIEGTYLPKNIEDMVVGPDGKRIFYINEVDNVGSGIVSDLNGARGSEIWNSPLSEFAVSWPKADTITLTTKPSGLVAGFLYFLNPSTLRFQKIIGDTLGLTTLTSPLAGSVLYGGSLGGSYALSVFDVISKTSSVVSLSTLPEKCIWSKKNMSTVYCAVPSSLPQGIYPDIWYQGITSFNDEIWQLNLETRVNKLLAKPAEVAGEMVDGTKLSLSPDEDYLFFINKKNSSLWSLRLVDKVATSTASGE